MDVLRLSARVRFQLGLPLPPISGGIDTKPLADIVEKWTRVTPGRAQDYTKGVARTPDAKYQDRTSAAAGSWLQAVSTPDAAARFRDHTAAAGGKWHRKVEAVGGTRFSSGVAAAGPDYSARFAPYLQALQSLTIDPKGPRGDPRNYARSQEVGQALHRLRVGGGR